MTDTRVGNARRFGFSNHRVDKDAFLEAVRDHQRTLSTAMAALDGQAAGYNQGGITSAVDFDLVTGPGTCTVRFLSPMTFFFSGVDADGRPIAKHLNYDPLSSAQGTTAIDLEVGETPLLLWFGRGQADVDEDNQVYWSAGEQRESTEVREMEFVDLVATPLAGNATVNDPQNGYAVFARVTAWDGSTPTIEFRDPVDALNTDGLGVSNFMIHPEVGSPPPEGFPFDMGSPRGLYQMMKRVCDLLLMFGDSENVIGQDGVPTNLSAQLGWFRHYAYGMRQLENFIPNGWNRQTRTVLFVATVESGEDPQFQVAFDVFQHELNDDFTLGAGAPIPLATAAAIVDTDESGGWKTTITFPRIKAGWTVTGIAVTPQTPYPITTTSVLVPQYAVSSALPFVGDGATDLVVDVRIVSLTDTVAPTGVLSGYTIVVFGMRTGDPNG